MKTLIFCCFFVLACMPLIAGYRDYDEHDYLDFLTANSFSAQDQNSDLKDAFTGISTNNKATLNLKYFGITAEFLTAKYQTGAKDSRNSYKVSHFGLGAGLPEADFLRLYLTYFWDKSSAIDPLPGQDDYQDNWLRLEAAKRFYSINMSSELAIIYTDYDGYHYLGFSESLPGLFDSRSHFAGYDIDTYIGVKAFVSSVTDELQEPASGHGIAPEDYPLLLVNSAALAFYLDYESIEFEDELRTNLVSARVPMNMSRHFGLDLGYRYTVDKDDIQKHKDHRVNILMRPVAISSGGFNLSLIANGIYEYYKNDFVDDENSYLSVGGIMSMNVKNHFGFYARYLNFNEWDLMNDASDIDNINFTIDAGLVLRY